MRIEDFDIKALSGRNRRLLFEWQQMEQLLSQDSDINWRVLHTNTAGLPTSYLVDYHIRSFCGVTDIERLNQPGVVNEPLFADRFVMQIDLPDNYPQIDAAPRFHFVDSPIPWHPNIRFFGDLAGHVCMNFADTYTGLHWGIERVAMYLHYSSYHALPEPPYPEDPQVALWVVRQAEPKGWIDTIVRVNR